MGQEGLRTSDVGVCVVGMERTGAATWRDIVTMAKIILKLHTRGH